MSATGAAPALELSAEEALVAAAVESMGAMATAAAEAAQAKPAADDEAAGETPPCVTCRTRCLQCTDPSIVRLKGVKRVDGCTACSGKCPPRVLWVGRRDAVTVHTVGYGAAQGEAWRWHPEVGVWELGLRTLLPTNTKRNRFQWLQRHGHKARPHPTLAMPLADRCGATTRGSSTCVCCRSAGRTVATPSPPTRALAATARGADISIGSLARGAAPRARARPKLGTGMRGLLTHDRVAFWRGLAAPRRRGGGRMSPL